MRAVALVLTATLAACTAADDTSSDTDPAHVPDVCGEQALPRMAFQADGGTVLGDVAGDFTFSTADGDYRFADAFTGCESYVFFVHLPGVNDAVMGTDMAQLFTDGPRNVQYFFLSDDGKPANRDAMMAQLSTNVDAALKDAIGNKSKRDAWRERIHFVNDRASKIEGSVGDFLTAYLAYAADPESRVDLGERGLAAPPSPTVFGIDRFQHFDGGDSLSPSVGEAPKLGMAAYLGLFYNYKAELAARLEAESDTTIVTLLDERTTGRVFTPAVTLPDAATMATFDQLAVDIHITCDLANPFGCSEWDRIADVQWCADGAACTQRKEIARWITPYWRRGEQHYLIDASALLGLIRAGGSQSFFVELGPDWERGTEWIAQVSLRLRNTGGERATAATFAFAGGGLNADYNTREAFHFTPPANASRVELVTILTGHDQVPANGCAEWCDHRHTFTVNGTDLPAIAHTEPSIGTPTGCAAHAADGVIPGQWGNWAQSRAYWCPGLAVPALRTDITALVTLGADNTLDYRAAYGTGAPAGGNVALSSYVVYSEAP